MANAARKYEILKFTAALGSIIGALGLAAVGCSGTDDVEDDASSDASTSDAKADGTGPGPSDAKADTKPDAPPVLPTTSAVRLNEVKTGVYQKAAGAQFFELAGEPETTLPDNTYFLCVSSSNFKPDGGTSNLGQVLYSYAVPKGTKFGKNGLVLVQAEAAAPYTAAADTTVLADTKLAQAPLYQFAASFIVVSATAPLTISGTTKFADLAGVTVQDAIGYIGTNTGDTAWPSSQVQIGGKLTGSQTPNGLARYLGVEAANTPSAWWGGRLVASDAGNVSLTNTVDPTKSPLPALAALPTTPVFTPGAPNPPAPTAPDGGSDADAGDASDGSDAADGADGADAADGDADAAD